MDYEIVNVTEANLEQHPQVICFTKPSDPAFAAKMNWLIKRFAEDLRLKLVYPTGAKRAVGYIEYTTGENAWRAVNAPGTLFINCLWITPNAHKNKGLASRLIQSCLDDAQISGCHGVAMMCSGDAFLAKREIFLKNGFQICDQAPSKSELFCRQFKTGIAPTFNLPTPSELSRYQGWHLIYSEQCPWVIRFVEEIRQWNKDGRIDLQVRKIETPQQAQHAPSLYSVFSLIHNGRILADHYISLTRFQNILAKESAIPQRTSFPTLQH